jgi:hypothetical protein
MQDVASNEEAWALLEEARSGACQPLRDELALKDGALKRSEAVIQRLGDELHEAHQRLGLLRNGASSRE